jgi:gamma-tubulin complex component 5
VCHAGVQLLENSYSSVVCSLILLVGWQWASAHVVTRQVTSSNYSCDRGLMQPSTSSSSGLPVPRPSSALSTRPSSSLSIHRDRPPSSLSTRPFSRLSTRHARNARLISLCSTLVAQLTGLEEEKDGGAKFRAVLASAMNILESSKAAAASVDIGVIDQQIRGYARNSFRDSSPFKDLPYRHTLKARINSRNQLSEALETCFRALRTQVEAVNDLDQDIKVCHNFLPLRLSFSTILHQTSRIPDHMQFLVCSKISTDYPA